MLAHVAIECFFIEVCNIFILRNIILKMMTSMNHWERGTDISQKIKIMNTYVASRSTPCALGGPYRINHINYSHFGVFLRRHTLDAPRLKHIILFVDVMSFNDAATSYVMSQHHTCIGHVTIYYKRAMNTSVGGVSISSLVC